MVIGSNYLGSGKTSFSLWALNSKQVSVHIVFPHEQRLFMKQDKKEGYWAITAEGIYPGYQYYYQLDSEKDYPDPASRFQPQGVHGPSQVIDNSFSWNDENWQGISLPEMVVYELHVGTFTPKGDFSSIIPRLDELLTLGINTIELMPVAQFPGERNWGYDGVYPFAVQNSYGNSYNLKKLIDACHQRKMAVLLDVVYNHLGPEGNYLRQFGPYFTEKYQTNWGQGINFDGPYSDEVKNYFIENTLFWLDEYHFDGLRLDAIHGIFDMSAKHFLAELSLAVENFSRKKKRKYYLIAESDLNDHKIVQSRYKGGYQMDAQWSDDFHHSLHALLTDEKTGYYQDFGKIQHMTKAIKDGFVYSGQYSPFRKRRHGNSSRFISSEKLFVYAQNHDQVGNRMLGERLGALVSPAALKLAAAMTILSPYIPLIFMGEEYGEKSPFLYFIDHSDRELVEAVRKGRKKEFAHFKWQQEPPDPQNEKTFLKSKIKWETREKEEHAMILSFYRYLLQLRRQYSLLKCPDRKNIEVFGSEKDRILLQKRTDQNHKFLMFFNFNSKEVDCNTKNISPSLKASPWNMILDSGQEKWLGDGSFAPNVYHEKDAFILKPYQFILYYQ